MLIEFLPRPLARFGLRIAHRLRHRWRRLAKPQLRGVCVFLHDPQGRMLFVRHAYGPDVWTLPGGGIDRGEEPEAAARREMREELGVTLSDLRSAGTLDETISGAPHVAFLYTATVDQVPEPDGREIVEIRFAPAGDPPQPLGSIAESRIAHLRSGEVRTTF
ncbi:NUDIX hydrolase [Alteriqipengyuania lutimaris]|uniref:NUDIX hydrolase n=1 Tax=Alteriqipengyuania lutimaris TaxID=1538146 RepID=UPI0018479DA1|nr:NUDIX domain-containing protein [Alteriqipengyuania lutimaris]MBB3034919.1 8-oxo-dGTP pyrophosphatase MutT (NUDIX family) [Alteriqipengyuania lutimaris]